MKRVVYRILVPFVAIAAVAGCDATIRTASKVTDRSAQLNANGRSACGVGGVFHFEYATSRSTVESGAGTRTPDQAFGETLGACDEDPPSYPFGRMVSGLKPETTYYYRLCGRDEGAASEQCTSISQFTTDLPPGPLQPITASGKTLVAGGEPIRLFGFNAPVEKGWNLYLRDPNPETAGAALTSLQHAKALGVNLARVGLQLFDFIERDASGALVTKPKAMAAYANLVRAAEQHRIYLDVVGNNVWLPAEAPSWYDGMTNEQRWQVQAFFWRSIAAAGANSPAIFAYELTNEPVVSADPNASWYGDGLGGYHFTQRIARGIPLTQQAAVARQWMTTLRNAIRERDTRHFVTVGGLPFPNSPFGAANQAQVLDVVSVHIYVQGDDVDTAVGTAEAFNATGKPMFIGETSLFRSNETAQRAFLERSVPHTSGVVSFFEGVGPDDQEVTTIPEAVRQANTRLFLSMRPVLMP
jgi:hypothetical protein